VSPAVLQRLGLASLLWTLLLVLTLAAFAWRWFDPRILRTFTWLSLIYLLIILALPTLATYISFFGGLLTFPLEEKES